MIPPTASQTGMTGETEQRPADRRSRSSAQPISQETMIDSSRRVLFLDDDPVRAEAFLSENPQAVWVQTVAECLEQLVERWDEVHLDHDLGGKTFVDVNESDCGMEVIRWLCREPRDHLREARFCIHTHNSIAGLLMVLQMRSSGYRAEFRPFGIDPARLLPNGENESFLDAEQPWCAESSEYVPPPQSLPQPPRGVRERLIGFFRPLWRFWRSGKM
jgi:hypothetical protein